MSGYNPSDRVAHDLVGGVTGAGKGRFTSFVMKDGSEVKGGALAAFIEQIKHDHRPNETFPCKINCELDMDVLPRPPPPARGSAGALSPPEMSFVYLDVGAWVGSSDGAWGQEAVPDGPSVPFKNKKRDFGVVCGPVMVLGTFACAYGGDDCPAWKRADKSREPFKSLAKLFEALSAPARHEAGGEPLGRAIVRDMIVASAVNPLWKREELVLHFVLGDMHVPVLDAKSQTYGAPFRDYQPKDVPERVCRFGRVDIGPLEQLVTSLVTNESDGAKFLQRLIHDLDTVRAQATSQGYVSPSDAAPAAVDAGVVYLKANAMRPVDENGIVMDVMSKHDAERWWEYYRTTQHGKPADIFEGAGLHFLHLAQRLAGYAAAQPAAELARLKFFQLGDMVDYWVGFNCHYDKQSPAAELPVTEVTPIGKRMVKVWSENLFGFTEQGRYVAEGLELLESSGQQPVYLYGNHDNYLGAGIRVKYPVTYPSASHASGDRALAPRRSVYHERGVFMEHGHQWEPANSDDSTVIPALPTRVIGRPAPRGLFVTQAAFIRPGQIRNFEGSAAGFVADVTHTFGQRMDQIVGAVYRYLAHAQGFYCYVMGHTHSAALTRVVVHPRRDEAARRRKDAEARRGVKLHLTANGRDFEDIHFQADPSAPVAWAGMLAYGEEEWIALDDKEFRRPGGFHEAIKGLAVANARSDGDHVFARVPPGVYVARYYLTRDASEPFRVSHNALAVEGLSFEGDEEHAETSEIVYDERKGFVRPLFLRWAFRDEHGFELSPTMEGNAFFALFRAGEPNEVTSINSYHPPHPLKRFTKAAPHHPNWGRWDVTARFPLWDLHHPEKRPWGDWRLRAFRDAVMSQPLGTLRLHVRKPRGH